MLTFFEQDDPRYATQLNALSRRGDADLERVEPAVREIIRRVREEGDSALREFTQRFDRRTLESFVVHDWRERARAVSAATRGALAQAAERVRSYHEHQRESGF